MGQEVLNCKWGIFREELHSDVCLLYTSKGVNQDKEEGIHSCADILEDYDNSYQNNGIDNQHEFSHGEGSVFVKDASEDISSSRSSPSIEDDP